MSESDKKSGTDSLWDTVGIDKGEISLIAFLVFIGFYFDIITFETAVIAMLGIIAIAATFSGENSAGSPMDKLEQFDVDDK